MKWTDEFLDPKRNLMDPDADELVKRIVAEEGHEGTRDLFHVLIRNINMPFDQVPQYVQDFFTEKGKIPAGIDTARLKRGQAVFMDIGSWFALILYYKSLPTCYLNWRGVEVLHYTGRTEKGREWPERFARRMVETTQFLLDVMAPNSLEAGGNGIATTLKVRLVHASIRYFILADNEWKPDKWQMPLNQEDLVFTLMTFSVSMIEAMEQLGRPLSEAEAEDYFYVWKLVGHFLGIEPGLMPDNVAEGRLLLSRVLERHQNTSKGGRAMTEALVAFSDLLIPTRFFDNASEILVTFFMGSYRAQLLGVHQKQGCLSLALPTILKKALGFFENWEEMNPDRLEKSNQMGINTIKALQNRMNNMKGRRLQVPEAFAKKWNL